MTITIGWWIIPTIITVIGLIKLFSTQDSGSNFMSGIGGMIDGLVISVIILISWLIYFIIF